MQSGGKTRVWRRWAATTTVMSLYGDEEHPRWTKKVGTTFSNLVKVHNSYSTALKLYDIQKKRNTVFYLLPCLRMCKFINLDCVLPMFFKATITSISVARILCYHIGNDYRHKENGIYLPTYLPIKSIKLGRK